MSNRTAGVGLPMSLQAAGSAGRLGHGLLAVARRGALDRDVKAGTLMHPLGANRACDYLSRTALGEETSLH